MRPCRLSIPALFWSDAGVAPRPLRRVLREYREPVTCEEAQDEVGRVRLTSE